jgi:hypothetical protein
MEGENLKAHGELVVLRLLVESMLISMSLEDQGTALLKFHQAAERLVADVLGDGQREDMLNAIQRAVRWQWLRLENLDAPVPPEALGSGRLPPA